MTETIHVDLGARSYDVHVGAGLIAQAGDLIAPFAPTKRVFIVTDRNVAKKHRPALAAALDAAGLENWTITLAPGERTKSFEGLELICRHLLQAGINRRALVIAFGGGVIGDLAGLAAGLVKRGVDFVQMPTTLLAQVDSSVGGKTAIDTPEGKNLVGLINQPRLVLADTDVLKTLPMRERRAGYAEIVKVALINDAQFFAWCETAVEHILPPEAPRGRKPAAAQAHIFNEFEDAALATAVKRAIEFKARIVEADETEQGPRALLNLGHTFAHALEAHAGYGELLHGEAVAAGMRLAFTLSAALGICREADNARVRAHLEKAGFVTDLRELHGAPYDPEKLMALMAADKKAEPGKLTFILARGIGRAYIDKEAPADVVRELLELETRQ
jgi:3-dehydroquinate synthase